MSDSNTKDPKQNVATIEEVEPGVFVRKSKNSRYIIEYHRDRCIGAGTCSQIAQKTFEMNDENIAEMINDPEKEEDNDDLLFAAAASCPAFAIIVKDAETGEQIFPVE